MINTVNIKEQQLSKGYFETGRGAEKMLIMGSCRVAGYVQYMDIWNRTIGNNRFTIYSIDPFNWHFDPVTNELVDLKEAIGRLETDERLLDMFKSVDFFIHEYYKNFGLFNIFKGDGDKNIYDYGMNPKVDIMIPSFNDIFILFSDFYKLDSEFREQTNGDYKHLGCLSHKTKREILQKAMQNFKKFSEVCLKSSLPEMRNFVDDNIKMTRFFWNFNHISKAFSLKVFELMNDKFLHLETNESFLSEIAATDMFKDVFTPLTEYDVEMYGFEWGEEVVDFKTYNKIGI